MADAAAALTAATGRVVSATNKLVWPTVAVATLIVGLLIGTLVAAFASGQQLTSG